MHWAKIYFHCILKMHNFPKIREGGGQFWGGRKVSYMHMHGFDATKMVVYTCSFVGDWDFARQPSLVGFVTNAMKGEILWNFNLSQNTVQIVGTDHHDKQHKEVPFAFQVSRVQRTQHVRHARILVSNTWLLTSKYLSIHKRCCPHCMLCAQWASNLTRKTACMAISNPLPSPQLVHCWPDQFWSQTWTYAPPKNILLKSQKF
jgi:hypothetical protein